MWLWSGVCGILLVRNLRLDAEEDKENREDVNPRKGEVHVLSVPLLLFMNIEVAFEASSFWIFSGIMSSGVEHIFWCSILPIPSFDSFGAKDDDEEEKEEEEVEVDDMTVAYPSSSLLNRCLS